jgi:hypothetical protein
LFILYELFGVVLITNEVLMEFGSSLPNWVQIQNPKNVHLFQQLNQSLDIGESSAICLAYEQNALLIIDERKGRNKATELNLHLIGTLGVLILAKRKGIIKEVKPFLDKLKSKGIWIHPTITHKILTEVNEL